MLNNQFQQGYPLQPQNEWTAQHERVQSCLASGQSVQAWKEAETLRELTGRLFSSDDIRWVLTNVASGEAAAAGRRFSLGLDFYGKAIASIETTDWISKQLLCDALLRAIDLSIHAQESTLGIGFCSRLMELASTDNPLAPLFQSAAQFRKAFLVSGNLRELTREAKEALNESFYLLDQQPPELFEVVLPELKAQLSLLRLAKRPDLLVKAQERAIVYLSSLEEFGCFDTDWHLDLVNLKIEQLDALLQIGEVESV